MYVWDVMFGTGKSCFLLFYFWDKLGKFRLISFELGRDKSFFFFRAWAFFKSPDQFWKVVFFWKNFVNQFRLICFSFLFPLGDFGAWVFAKEGRGVRETVVMRVTTFSLSISILSAFIYLFFTMYFCLGRNGHSLSEWVFGSRTDMQADYWLLIKNNNDPLNGCNNFIDCAIHHQITLFFMQ